MKIIIYCVYVYYCIGSIIYGKLSNIDYKNVEIELTCKQNINKDWNSGESVSIYIVK